MNIHQIVYTVYIECSKKYHYVMNSDLRTQKCIQHKTKRLSTNTY